MNGTITIVREDRQLSELSQTDSQLEEAKQNYIGPVALKPDNHKINLTPSKPVLVNAATKADHRFKWMVQDCVKSLRVHKNKK